MFINKVNTTICIDSNLKAEATLLFNELGLDLSSAITLFLNQAVREQAIPFLIDKHPQKAKVKKSKNSYFSNEKN